jgi:outer membrane protein, heavy metal efflux system
MVVVCAAARARAEAPDPVPPAIDESQLLARVAQTDPRLLRITAEVEAARADVVAAGVRPNPSVALEREEVFPSGGLSTSYLRLELPLEISGRRARRVEAARAATDAAAIEGEGARFAIAIEALRAFRTAAYERLRVELLRAEREALVKAVEVVQKRTRAGTTAGYDLQRIELELAVYDDLIAAAESRLATVRLELGALAGAPAGLDAADPLELPADPPALEELLREAIERRPEYRAAGARLAGARSLRGAASRARVPELTLSGGLVRQDVAADTAAFGYTAGLVLSLPLFDHGQAERARANALMRAAEAERKVAWREVPARVRAWHQILVRTIARGRTARQAQLGRLDQLLRSAEAAYREGGGNVVELLDAYGAARDARLRDLELRRDARLVELDLWLALGRRP